MKYRLILKEDTCPKNLYHLSDNKNLDRKILKPSIPKLKFDDENSTTKRVCFSTTIDGCLQGLYPIYPDTSLDDPRYTSFNGKYLYVYEPINSDFSYVDTDTLVKKRLVPDAEVSKEVWITSSVKVKLVGKIYVYPYDSAKLFKFIWRGKQDKPAIGVKLKWKWVDKLKESYLKESSDFEDVKTILRSLSKEDLINASTDNKQIDPNHMKDSKECMFRYIYRVNKQPAGYVELYPLDSDPKNTAIIQYSVATNFQRQGIGRKLLDIAVNWCTKHKFKTIEYYVKKTNIKSLQAGLKYGFKVFDQNKKWVYMKLNLKSRFREDLGNTPKGYKDITHIIEECNKWFEANADKNCNICWNQHMQIKKWALELKKYRSKKGPITFERELKKLKLKPKKDNEIKMNLDCAILHAFSNWRKNKFDMEDRNRELMYCLIELREYRKKFGKDKEFSCKI